MWRKQPCRSAKFPPRTLRFLKGRSDKRGYAGKGMTEAHAEMKKRRNTSPETRAQMEAAARARLAKVKGANTPQPI